MFFNMLLGYARLSTDDQTARLQLDALEAAGCERTFSERASGAAAERPVLAELLSHSRMGDALVVWRLDRLGRSLPHLIKTVQKLENAASGLRSLADGIDTTTPNGRLIFHLFGALARFERELIRERTMAWIGRRAGPRAQGWTPAEAQRRKAAGSSAAFKGPRIDGVSRGCKDLGYPSLNLAQALHGAVAKQVDGVGRGLVRAV